MTTACVRAGWRGENGLPTEDVLKLRMGKMYNSTIHPGRFKCFDLIASGFSGQIHYFINLNIYKRTQAIASTGAKN